MKRLPKIEFVQKSFIYNAAPYKIKSINESALTMKFIEKLKRVLVQFLNTEND